MASPPDRLCTHHGGMWQRCAGFRFARPRNKSSQRAREGRRLHVVGVSTKPFVTPHPVQGILSRLTKSSELWHVAVDDPAIGERFPERLALEMRMPAGARDRSDVSQLPDPMSLEHPDEFIERSRGMADGVDRQDGRG